MKNYFSMNTKVIYRKNNNEIEINKGQIKQSALFFLNYTVADNYYETKKRFKERFLS